MVYPPTPTALPAASLLPPLRPAPRFFEFASPSEKVEAHRNGISAARIRELVRLHGNNIVIGFDMGKTKFDSRLRGVYTHEQALAQTELARNSAMLEAYNEARRLGVRLHAYLGGPGGPTGSRITDGEMEHMRTSAGLVGIDTSRSNWMNEWNDWGWKKAAQEQLKVIKQLGFESYELDNLERDARIRAPRDADTAMKTSGLIDLYRETAKWDGSLRLMMKNLEVENLQGVEQAMNSGLLNRRNFADFHISEENNRSRWPAIERASARIGIQLARSHDTYNYATTQAYSPSLEADMLRFSNLQTNIAMQQHQEGWRINAQATPRPVHQRSDQTPTSTPAPFVMHRHTT